MSDYVLAILSFAFLAAVSMAIRFRSTARRVQQSNQVLSETLSKATRIMEDQARQIELLRGLERERDIWRDKYMEDSAGHGAAQAMLVRQILVLYGTVKRLGGKLDLDPTVARVCNELGLGPES